MRNKDEHRKILRLLNKIAQELWSRRLTFLVLKNCIPTIS